MNNDSAMTMLRASGYTVSHEPDGRILVSPSAARGCYWPSGCGSIRFGDAVAAVRFLLNEAQREQGRAAERALLVEELEDAESAADAALHCGDRDAYAKTAAARDEAQQRLDDFDAQTQPGVTP
jgi:hypothetical protein